MIKHSMKGGESMRGRPVMYKDNLAKVVVQAVQKHGLSGAREVLSEGVQVKAGTKKQSLKVSMGTLIKLAKQAGLTFKRGRPKKEAA